MVNIILLFNSYFEVYYGQGGYCQA